MNTLGGYFVNDMKDSKTKKENIVLGKFYRISILTERLVRLEYSKEGKFEDNPTQRIVFRDFPKNNFTVTQTETLIQIVTPNYTIDYVKDHSFIGTKVAPATNLKITLNGTERSWNYNHPEARNYGSVTYSLDDFKGRLKLDKGLYSTDGFCFIDDSDSMVLNERGNFVKRSNQELDFYVFMYKKDLGLCLQDYFKLTGYPLMVPRYALGNWWHKNARYTNNDISKTVKKFKEEDIPISVFLLGDRCYTNNEPFYLDNSILDALGLKKTLDEKGIKLGVTVKPDSNIPTGSSIYKRIMGMYNDTSGKSFSFLPIDNNKLNVYSTEVINRLANSGVSTFNIKYVNPKDKVSLALLNHYHYTYESISYNKRSIVLTRNHNIAIHRYGIINSGETNVDWNTLEVLPRYNSSASNMGLSYVVNAIGGYKNGIENFELFIRYIQLGVFSSFLVLASDDGKYYRREPWRWNLSQCEIIKKYLQLRYKLIPYIYTEAYIYHKTGSPIIQPLYYKYPKVYDEPLYTNQYFFGQSMLVCPITKKKNTVMNRVVQRLFIPEGVWYELESGKKFPGNKYYMSFYKDEDYPVFCKEGSIIVMSLDLNTDNPTNLEVDVFPGCSSEYKLYEDDGISNNFKNGNFAITEYKFDYSPDKYELSISPVSNQGLNPDYRNYKIKFRNTNAARINVTDGYKSIKATAEMEGNDLIVNVPSVINGQKIIVTCTSEKLENSTLKLINDDIKGILEDLEIDTILKEKIDDILFGNAAIRKKRIAIRKLRRKGLEPKFVKMFLNLLEYIDAV
ncbi:MAG: TIM-barrel domain-containing protein [Bacilli bacterium]|nr:TIM-barrel domain-containing protein [Bacilli bacterium]